MPMPLEGIRVLDWTIWQQGPVCSSMLADLGADVIKIEERGVGDPGRHLVRRGRRRRVKRAELLLRGQQPQQEEPHARLEASPRRARCVYALAEKSDVFVQNFRQGVAARLGLDYATLREQNPRLIYASATGYGPDGPESGEPSFDHLGLARSGIMLAAGEPDMPPLGIAGGIADQMGGVMLAYGVLAALLARERTARGQEVDASHLGSMLLLQGLSRLDEADGGLRDAAQLPRARRQPALEPLPLRRRQVARARDAPARPLLGRLRARDRPPRARDRRALRELCARARERRRVRRDPRRGLREQAARRVDRAPGEDAGRLHLHDREHASTTCPTIRRCRRTTTSSTLDHPQHGPTQMVGVPVRLSETPGSVRTPAPELGQHTEEILLDVLGCDWDRISALREKGVI